MQADFSLIFLRVFACRSALTKKIFIKLSSFHRKYQDQAFREEKVPVLSVPGDVGVLCGLSAQTVGADCVNERTTDSSYKLEEFWEVMHCRNGLLNYY